MTSGGRHIVAASSNCPLQPEQEFEIHAGRTAAFALLPPPVPRSPSFLPDQGVSPTALRAERALAPSLDPRPASFRRSVRSPRLAGVGALYRLCAPDASRRGARLGRRQHRNLEAGGGAIGRARQRPRPPTNLPEQAESASGIAERVAAPLALAESSVHDGIPSLAVFASAGQIKTKIAALSCRVDRAPLVLLYAGGAGNSGREEG
jgi:hypothetical protein